MLKVDQGQQAFSGPKPSDDREPDQLFFHLEIARQWDESPRTSYDEATRPGAHEASKPDEEAYWFTTFLESPVRGQKRPSEGAGLDEPPRSHPTLPLMWGLSSGDGQGAPPLRAPPLFTEARRSLGRTFEQLKANDAIERHALEQLVNQIVSNIVVLSPDTYDLRSPLFGDTLFSFVYTSFGRPNDLVDHSLNVAVLSVMVAKKLGVCEADLARVCLAALVHDVGMLLLPSATLEQPRTLSEKEWTTVKYHAELGQELVSTLGGSLKDVAVIVGQEHERADGEGYPLGLRSHQIERFAKIIGLVDVFEALTHGRPHRPALTPHQAVRKLLAELRAGFDYEVLKAFMTLITVFPLGSLVELSTGEVARVVQVNGANPLRPLVEVVCDAEGLPVPSSAVRELWSNPTVSISRCLDAFPGPC